MFRKITLALMSFGAVFLTAGSAFAEGDALKGGDQDLAMLAHDAGHDLTDARVPGPGVGVDLAEQVVDALLPPALQGEQPLALLRIPVEALPDNLKESMGAEWRLREKNKKILEEHRDYLREWNRVEDGL